MQKENGIPANYCFCCFPLAKMKQKNENIIIEDVNDNNLQKVKDKIGVVKS